MILFYNLCTYFNNFFLDDRSRSKEKKSILGSIRRRLSFKKTRSKSTENRSESSNYSQESSRSASSDRIRSKAQKPSPVKGKFMGKFVERLFSYKLSVSLNCYLYM